MSDPNLANTPNAALPSLVVSERDAKQRVEDHAVSVSLAPAAPGAGLRPRSWSRGLALVAVVGLAGGAAIAAREHSSASKPRNGAALLAGRASFTLPVVTIIGEAAVNEAAIGATNEAAIGATNEAAIGATAPLTLPEVTIVGEPPRDGARMATTAALVTPATLPASTTALATSPASLSR